MQPWPFVLVALVSMTFVTGVSASAGTPDAFPPTPERLATIRQAMSGHARVRVRTPDGTVLLNRAAASEQGVSGLLGLTQPGSITSMREEPTLVSWSEIEGVERVSSGMGRGILWGMGIGLVAGVLTAARIPPDEPRLVDDADAGPPAPVLRTMAVILSPAAFGILGAAVGNAFPRWERVYPGGPKPGAAVRPSDIPVRDNAP